MTDLATRHVLPGTTGKTREEENFGEGPSAGVLRPAPVAEGAYPARSTPGVRVAQSAKPALLAPIRQRYERLKRSHRSRVATGSQAAQAG